MKPVDDNDHARNGYEAILRDKNHATTISTVRATVVELETNAVGPAQLVEPVHETALKR